MNDALKPLLAGGRHDVEVLLAAAETGAAVQTDRLRLPLAQGEITAAVRVLGHLVRVRDVLLRVNAAYIASAQMDDAMRGEPRFQLQGSYRNMARLAQRIVPVMTAAEVDRVVADHYRTEAQTLGASGAWNLAKWREVVGVATPEELVELDALRARWKESAVAADPGAAVVGALRAIESALRDR